jgi:Transposase DDE domain
VIGQDIEETADGRFIIAQGSRRIGSSRWWTPGPPRAQDRCARLDGYKGHVAIDPDSEVICSAEVGAANAGDAAMAAALLADLPKPPAARAIGGRWGSAAAITDQAPADPAPVVYGDAAYGTGALLADLEQRGITAMTKVAAPPPPPGTSPTSSSASTCTRARSPARRA